MFIVIMMQKSVAEIIVDYLVAGGVRRIYGIPGDSIDPLVEAIRKTGTLKYVQVRHEEGGAFAASFDAKLNRIPAACFGTSGPGSIHLLNGLYDAKMDKAPVIAITGQVDTEMIGHDYHQEVNITKLFDDVSIFNRMIVDARSVPYLIARAIRESKRMSGVAHLNIPVNILAEKIEVPRPLSTYSSIPILSPDLSEAAKAIDESKFPVLLVGSGSTSEQQLITALSKKIGAPIIYALMGKGIFSDDNPRVLGALGLLGSKPSMEAMAKADLIVAIGTTYPYQRFISEKAKIIQVDIDGGNLGREFQVDFAVLSDSHTFLASIIEKVSEKKDKFELQFAPDIRSWNRELQEIESRKYRFINPARLARVISQKADPDAVIVGDTGNTTVWIARHFGARGGQRFLFSGGLASMGCSLPGGIGVSLSTDRQVISAVGDGGMAMTIMELATVKKYNIPVKIVVFNNSKLAMIKFEQEVMGYPQWGVDLINPEFSTLASAYGIDTQKIVSDSEIEAAVDAMLKSKGPFLLEAIVDPNAKPMPPKISFDQAKGYLIAGVKERIGYQPEMELNQ